MVPTVIPQCRCSKRAVQRVEDQQVAEPRRWVGRMYSISSEAMAARWPRQAFALIMARWR